ncbi:hypothetical protein [Tenacibaculum salmonis]|uniref:hypothetical protein n=1 Tax=Tenacibaculum sp. P3-BQ1 TaxID=3232310 RepID=UPI0034DF1B9D
MKNSILNLGKVLNKAEQKEVNGGLARCHFGKFPNTGCSIGFLCSSDHRNGTCVRAL